MKHHKPRGTVLLAVLVVLALGSIIVLGIVTRAGTRLDESRARLDQLQARSLAQSGLEAVMVEIAQQRAVLLAGGQPALTQEWNVGLGNGEEGPNGVIRLLPVRSSDRLLGDDGLKQGFGATSDSSKDDELCVSQAGCVDLGVVPPTMLAALLGRDAGARLAALRGNMAPTSVVEALSRASIEGSVAANLPERARVADYSGASPNDADESDSSQSVYERRQAANASLRGNDVANIDASDANGSLTDEAGTPWIEDVLTVHSSDPIGIQVEGTWARLDTPGRVTGADAVAFAKSAQEVFGAISFMFESDRQTDSQANSQPGIQSNPDLLGTSGKPDEAKDTNGFGESRSFSNRATDERLNAERPSIGSKDESRPIDIGSALAKAFGAKVTPTSTSTLVRALSGAGVPQSAWRVAWGVRFTDDEFVRGRIDINRAPIHVLAAIPGFDAQIAKSIYKRRSSLSDEARADPMWPLREGLVSEDVFISAADWITTRSLQWRVRIEASIVNAEAQRSESSDQIGTAAPMSRVVLDAIIDAAGARVRVAYVLDATLEDAIDGLRAARMRYAEERDSGLVRVDMRENEDKSETGSADESVVEDLAQDLPGASWREPTRREKLVAERARVRPSPRDAARQRRGEKAGESSADSEAETSREAGTETDNELRNELASEGGSGASRTLGSKDNRVGRWKRPGG